ncbi:hypothetical protein ACWD4J_35770 [Streptomyces sp. NPDC002577]
MAFLPMALMTGLMSLSAARVSARLGSRTTITIGQVLMAADLAVLYLVRDPHPPGSWSC